MSTEQDISRELQAFGPYIIAVLNSVDFSELEGSYDPMELDTAIKSQPEYRRYVAESKKKNSRVWDIVQSLLIPAAIGIGIRQIQKDYKPWIAKAEARRIADNKPKLSAQAYQAAYIKEHGGEFITRMSQTDQKKLTNFLWQNAGVNERPLAKTILKTNPQLGYLVDSKEYRLRMIKRTEIGRATGYGAMNFAGDNGAKTKTRHSVFAKNSRKEHMAMSGQTRPIDKPYSNGELFCKENSINCFCYDTFAF